MTPPPSPCPPLHHIALPPRTALLPCHRPLTIATRLSMTRIESVNVGLASGVTPSIQRTLLILVRSLPPFVQFYRASHVSNAVRPASPSQKRKTPDCDLTNSDSVVSLPIVASIFYEFHFTDVPTSHFRPPTPPRASPPARH